jgi:anti-sigma-K factor RskA
MSDEPTAKATASRFVRPGLWRALGGMGLAFGIACAIVLVEVSTESTRRVRRLDRRVGSLKSSVQKLEQKSERVEAQLEAVRPQVEVDQLLSRVLVAPDLRTIRLAAADAHRSASGNILMSSRNSAAVLSATGLEPSADGKVYRLWWIGRRGAAVKAAEFQVASAGHVSIAAEPPPNGGDTVEARLTLEPLADAQKPSGQLALSGRLGR